MKRRACPWQRDDSVPQLRDFILIEKCARHRLKLSGPKPNSLIARTLIRILSFPERKVQLVSISQKMEFLHHPAEKGTFFYLLSHSIHTVHHPHMRKTLVDRTHDSKSIL